MAAAEEITVWIGYDSREAVASHVAAHSIKRHTTATPIIKYLKHRELRSQGYFARPWQIKADTGDFEDMIDCRPFTTEFSHTRFLVPELQNFRGWALFMDADMIFQSDIKRLFKLCNDRFAVMCVQHNHRPMKGSIKMDNRLQNIYFRKNWSSFVLWNCSHPSNKKLTKEKVNYMKGGDLHAFKWLQDHEIGELPWSYNYISGVSPNMPLDIKGNPVRPDVIHYTEGGPWFDECQDVPYGALWLTEHESWCREGDNAHKTSVQNNYFDEEDRVRTRK